MTTVDTAIAGGALRPRPAPDGAVARRPATRTNQVTARARTQRHRLLAAMAAVVATSAVAAGVVLHVDMAADTHTVVSRLARARAAVAAATDAERAARDELQATGMERVTAGASLDGGIEALRTAAAEAAMTIAKRDEALVALVAAEDELGAVAGSLTAAGAEREARDARIIQLRSCLTGVNRALTLTAFNDHGGALRALAAVSSTCDAARVAP